MRLENSGCNIVQVAGGSVIIAISFLTLYVIPNNTMNMESSKAYFNLNLLLLAVVIGTILMSQGLAPGLARVFLDIIFKINPRDKIMAPLIKKNLETHALKNMKANLMYTVTICFLVYSGTNFMASTKYLRQMAGVIFGADICLRDLRPHG